MKEKEKVIKEIMSNLSFLYPNNFERDLRCKTLDELLRLKKSLAGMRMAFG